MDKRQHVGQIFCRQKYSSQRWLDLQKELHREQRDLGTHDRRLNKALLRLQFRVHDNAFAAESAMKHEHIED